MDVDFSDVDEEALAKQRNLRAERIARLQDQVAREAKLKAAHESMLQLYANKDPQACRDIQNQLDAVNQRLGKLQQQLVDHRKQEDLQRRQSKKHSLAESQSHNRSQSASRIQSPQQSQTRSLKSADSVASLMAKFTQPDAQPFAGSQQDKLDAANDLLKCLKQNMMSLPDAHKLAFRLMHDSLQEIRAMGFRIIRYTLHIFQQSGDQNLYTLLWRNGLELVMLKSMTRDAKGEIEREQAFKLLRAYCDLDGGVLCIPRSLVSLVVVIAENADDKFKLIALQTLCELTLRNVALVAACGGLKVILQTLIDGTPEMVDMAATVVLAIADQPSSRQYIRPYMELEVVISNFTDTTPQVVAPPAATSAAPAAVVDKVHACCRSMTRMLQTWTGLLYLCINGSQSQDDAAISIKFLVDALAQPYNETKVMVLDMLLDTFDVNVPAWLSDLGTAAVAHNLSVSHVLKPTPGYLQRYNFRNHLIAMLLAIFIDCKLFIVLMDVAESAERSTATRAVMLLRHLLNLCGQLLLKESAASVYSLPNLFKVASRFADERQRNLALTAMVHIDDLNLTANETQQSGEQDVALRIYQQSDDADFKRQITDSTVLTNKDFTTWNWECIEELLAGPLQNPKRLEDVLKTTRFVKRLLAFYRPDNHRFADMKLGKSSQRYIACMHILFALLTGNVDGLQYLAGNKFMGAICKCFDQFSPDSVQSTTNERFWSKSRLEKTVNQEYFIVLAMLFADKEGCHVLEECDVHDSLYMLTQLKNRDQLNRLLVQSMDYSHDGHARTLLMTVLSCGYKSLREYATSHLLVVFHTGKPFQWAMEVLATQLYDPAIEVCHAAVNVLNAASRDLSNLKALIACRPRLDHLGQRGSSLIRQFAAVPEGFQYLQEMEYLDMELLFWMRQQNTQYALRAELSLSQAASKNKSELVEREQVQSHFMGELAKTQSGCEYMSSKNVLQLFNERIQVFMQGSANSPQLNEIKGIVWALGHIGSSAAGGDYLAKADMIRLLVRFGVNAQTLSLKGVCIMAFGLISQSVAGCKDLHQQGWRTPLTEFDEPLGYAIPIYWRRFVNVSAWKYASVQLSEPSADMFKGFEGQELEVIKHIGNMSNNILASASSKALSRTKSERPSMFTNFQFYIRVMRIVNSYHYRLTTRRYLAELFDGIDLSEHNLDSVTFSDSLQVRGGVASTSEQTQVSLPTVIVNRSRNNSAAAVKRRLSTAKGVASQAITEVQSLRNDDGGQVEADTDDKKVLEQRQKFEPIKVQSGFRAVVT